LILKGIKTIKPKPKNSNIIHGTIIISYIRNFSVCDQNLTMGKLVHVCHKQIKARIWVKIFYYLMSKIELILNIHYKKEPGKTKKSEHAYQKHFGKEV